MKHIRITLTILFALLLFTAPLKSQDNRTLETKVADLLVQIPASDDQKLNAQIQSMLDLEEAGLQMILDLVIPAGTGDDTKARMAIESLSRYYSQSELKMESMGWEEMILKEIEKREDGEIKSFFISQLYYFGSGISVSSLSAYLTNAELQDPAIRAMRDIDPIMASEYFVEQLNICDGRTQIALVNAIKNNGNSAHSHAVAALAGSDSHELQRSVLACLAQLGHPDSYGLLNNAAKETGYMPEPTNATGSLIVYARTLSKEKMHDLSLKICKILIKKCSTPEQVGLKSGALTTAAGNNAIDKSVSLLVDAMKDKNKPYRMTAIRYAAANNTPVEPWISALDKSKNNEVKAEILSLFGMLKAHETVQSVSSYMDDPDAAIRQQAILSLAQIQSSEAVPAILEYTLSYPTDPDSKTAKAALLQTVGMDQLPLLTAALDGAPEGAKVILLEVIAARGDPASFDILYAQIDQGGKVRSTVLKNLYLVSDQGDLGNLMKLFDQLEDGSEIAAIETALVAAIKRGSHKEVSTQALLLHAANTFTIEKYIGVLAKVGGKEALEAVYESYSTGDEESRKRAFTGLIKSNDIYAASPLFQICSQTTAARDKSEAFNS